MAVLTGRNGALRWNGTPAGKVRSWSLDVSRDALETTNLGIADRTYVAGLRGATGSAEVMYDPTDTTARSLFNSVLAAETEPVNSVGFVFDSATGRSISCSAFVTSVSPSVSVGEVQTCSVSFQVSGPLTGGF